jgi:hypothetical protein
LERVVAEVVVVVVVEEEEEEEEVQVEAGRGAGCRYFAVQTSKASLKSERETGSRQSPVLRRVLG